MVEVRERVIQSIVVARRDRVRLNAPVTRRYYCFDGHSL
jgi:hypothetical protein